MVIVILAGLLLAALPGSLGAQGNSLGIAKSHLERNAAALGLTPADLLDKVVTARYRSEHTGVTHIHFRQRLAGIEVANGVINVNIRLDGKVLDVGNRFVANLAARATTRRPSIDAQEAIERAAEQLGLGPAGALVEIESLGGPSRAARFDGAGISLEEIPVKLAYYALDSGTVRLAWDMVIRTPDHRHWYNLWVDAVDGRILAKNDWIARDTYEVFALPKDSPSDGPRSIEVDPADSTASPFGWHDTDGMAGAEFTDTRGNNVQAQTDLDANNSFGGSDIRADGGMTLDFQFPLDPNMQPDTYREAAVTNLFYWNNIIHDILYGYGFDEASGNFQSNNYGNPGLGGDPVQADAQDGSGINNANFGTPPDGSKPRMQMFLWLATDTNEVEVNAPSPAAGVYLATPAQFGPQLDATGVSSLALTLAADGVGNPTDGCDVVPNEPIYRNKIVLIDRGDCTFVRKVRNAQDFQALGVIVANNVGGDPVIMGDDGSGGDITIPSVMVSQSDGQTIRNGFPAGGTIRENANPTPDRDSDLDAGVIAHEFCHGLSNRLTGGPGNVNCLSGSQQAGEGWSDLCTLLLTADSSDTAMTPRGVGTYLIYELPTGGGIRPFPYTTDIATNPLTYGDIVTAGRDGLSIPHGVGTVWATAVWEVYWNLVAKHGFDSDLYNGTGGNNLAIQLVLDGLKLQPCNPTFVDARDAILLADLNLTGGLNQCEIWNGFAKRGLGINAFDGGGSGSLMVTEDFTVPAACLVGAVPGEASDIVVNGIDPNTDMISLSYTPACSGANHNIVWGPLEDVSIYNYTGQDCGIGISGFYNQFNPGIGSYFFLLVGTDSVSVEGSYGLSSALVERPEDLDDPVCAFSQGTPASCGGP